MKEALSVFPWQIWFAVIVIMLLFLGILIRDYVQHFNRVIEKTQKLRNRFEINRVHCKFNTSTTITKASCMNKTNITASCHFIHCPLIMPHLQRWGHEEEKVEQCSG